MGALVTYAKMVEDAQKKGERALLIMALNSLYIVADEIIVGLELDHPTHAEAMRAYHEQVGADLTPADEE